MNFNHILYTALVTITAATPSFSRFYAGGQIGASQTRGEHTYINPDKTSQPTTKVTGFGATYGLHAGYSYGFTQTKAFLAGEIFVNMGGSNVSKTLVPSTPSEGSFSVKKKMGYGVSILAGMALNPKMSVYGKIGAQRTSLDMTYTNLSFQTPNNEKYTKTIVGITPGAGFMYKMHPNIGLSMEYTFIMYKKITPRSESQTINGAQRGFSFSPSEHQIVFKIAYRFG